MANLKADLLNELRNQKYYSEMELLRLAQDPTMKYRDKVLDIDEVLGEVALINQKLALAEAYFQNPEQPVEQPPVDVPQAPQEGPTPEMLQDVPDKQPVPEQQVVNQPLPGQSHGE